MNTGIYSVVDSLGWALSHSLWQGILVWLVFSLSHLTLSQASPHVRHLNALMWLLILIFSPVVTFFMYLGQPTSLALDATAIQASTAHFSSAVFGFHNLMLLPQTFPFMVKAWMAVVSCLSLRTFFSWYRVQSLSSKGCFPLPEWQSQLFELAQTMGVKVTVTIRESIQVHVPTVSGWLKPVILLPTSALIGLSPRELELIISHELAHIRRLDYAINYLLIVAENCLFFHPAVYAITGVIRHERELCCDDLVVQRCGDRLCYAQALTKLETLRGNAILTSQKLRLAATDGPLLLRIRRLVNVSQFRRNGVVPAMGLVFAAMLGGGASAWAVFNDSRHDLALGRGLQVEPITLINSNDQKLDTMLESANYAVRSALSDQPSTTAVAFDRLFKNIQSGKTKLPNDKPKAIESSLHFVEQALSRTQANDRSFRQDRASFNLGYPQSAAFFKLAADAVPIVIDPYPLSELSAVYIPAVQRFDARSLLPKSVVAATVAQQAKATISQAYSGLSTGVATQNRSQPGRQSRAEFDQYTAKAPLEPNVPVEPGVIEHGGELVREVSPRYPSHARLRGKEDTVEVEFQVDRSGKVTNVTVISEESTRMFERSVIRAVSQWSFEPMFRNGRAVERTLKRSFDFKFVS